MANPIWTGPLLYSVVRASANRGTMEETREETRKTRKLLNEGKKRYEGIEVNHN